jgi:hypothetical protein
MPRLWDASGVPRVSGTYVFFDAVWGERIVKGEQALRLSSVPRGKTRRRCLLPRLRCRWTSSGQRGFVGQRDGQTQDDRKGPFHLQRTRGREPLTSSRGRFIGGRISLHFYPTVSVSRLSERFCRVRRDAYDRTPRGTSSRSGGSDRCQCAPSRLVCTEGGRSGGT